MEQIISLYGYRTKKGFMCCPFHGEKEPSLKVYKDTGGWHCFGCERGGSVIDFVMMHENCNFPTAVRGIDHALHLGLMDAHEDPLEVREQKRIQATLDNFCEAVYAYCDALIKVAEITQTRDYQRMKQLEELREEHADRLTQQDYMFLLTWEEESKYTDYQIEKINEFKEEVAEWRRKARRAI